MSKGDKVEDHINDRDREEYEYHERGVFAKVKEHGCVGHDRRNGNGQYRSRQKIRRTIIRVCDRERRDAGTALPKEWIADKPDLPRTEFHVGAAFAIAVRSKEDRDLLSREECSDRCVAELMQHNNDRSHGETDNDD